MTESLTKAFSALVVLAIAFAAGYWVANERGKQAAADAVAEANRKNLERSEEIVHGWNSAVTVLRDRIRRGYAPRIPVSPATPETNAACGLDGRPTYGLSLAGELATCKAERSRLIEDCAMTTIQLRSFQDWAKP